MLIAETQKEIAENSNTVGGKLKHCWRKTQTLLAENSKRIAENSKGIAENSKGVAENSKGIADNSNIDGG